jgi:hypothetical protein
MLAEGFAPLGGEALDAPLGVVVFAGSMPAFDEFTPPKAPLEVTPYGLLFEPGVGSP